MIELLIGLRGPELFAILTAAIAIPFLAFAPKRPRR